MSATGTPVSPGRGDQQATSSWLVSWRSRPFRDLFQHNSFNCMYVSCVYRKAIHFSRPACISLLRHAQSLSPLLFFFWPSCTAFGILVPRPGVKPPPSGVKAARVLTTGPPGNSLHLFLLITTLHFSFGYHTFLAEVQIFSGLRWGLWRKIINKQSRRIEKSFI